MAVHLIFVLSRRWMTSRTHWPRPKFSSYCWKVQDKLHQWKLKIIIINFHRWNMAFAGILCGHIHLTLNSRLYLRKEEFLKWLIKLPSWTILVTKLDEITSSLRYRFNCFKCFTPYSLCSDRLNVWFVKREKIHWMYWVKKVLIKFMIFTYTNFVCMYEIIIKLPLYLDD